MPGDTFAAYKNIRPASGRGGNAAKTIMKTEKKSFSISPGLVFIYLLGALLIALQLRSLI